MGGSRDSDLPDWSCRGSRKFKHPDSIIVKIFRPKPFRYGQFKSEEDVVRFFEGKGAKITGVSVDPDPNVCLNHELCESYLEKFAEDMARSNKHLLKEYNRQIVTICGFIIDGFYGKDNVEK